MRFMRTTFMAALATLGVALAAAGPAVATPGGTVGHVRPAIDTVASFPDYSLTAHRNRFVILQAWQTDRLHALKAADPSVRVLVYKNLAFSAQLGSSHVGPSPSGVWYSEAPDSWFLKNTDGNRFTSWSYSWLWAMDIGDPEYQQRWADNVVSEVTSEGWDGVFLDDTNATMKYHYETGRVAKYPNDASYGAAMGSALSHVASRVRGAGKLAIPNFAAWVEYPSVYNSWLQHVDGALDEMFVKWSKQAGQGYRGEGQWTTQVENAKYAASQGKAFLAFTQGAYGEADAARYGYASALLAANGNAAFAFTPDYGSEPWFPEYDYDLGTPIGAETRDANGVHRRVFERGLVLVNPTGSTQSVNFNGTYSGSGLSAATGATMTRNTALVLVGTQAPPSDGTSSKGNRGGGKGNGKKAKLGTMAIASTIRPNRVQLSWSRARRGARRYAVIRNGRVITRTKGRSKAERGLKKRRVYRYRVVALNKKRQVVATSKVLRLRPRGKSRRIVQRPERRVVYRFNTRA